MTTTKSQSIIIPCTKKICLNCDHFDHYFTPNRGNVMLWHPTDRGRCRDKQKELDAFQRGCKAFEFVKPK